MHDTLAVSHARAAKLLLLCMLCRDTVQVYQQLYESGLQYGPAFRLLRNIHVPDVSAAAA